MLRVLPFLLMTAAAVWAFVECLQTETVAVRTLPKAAWVVIICLGWFLGAVAWFVFGRPRATAAVGGAAPVRGPAVRRSRPLGPDDDPEFLARMRDQLRRDPPDPTGDPRDPRG